MTPSSFSFCCVLIFLYLVKKYAREPIKSYLKTTPQKVRFCCCSRRTSPRMKSVEEQAVVNRQQPTIVSVCLNCKKGACSFQGKEERRFLFPFEENEEDSQEALRYFLRRRGRDYFLARRSEELSKSIPRYNGRAIETGERI